MIEVWKPKDVRYHHARYIRRDELKTPKGLLIHSMAQFVKYRGRSFPSWEWLDKQVEILENPYRKTSAHAFIQPSGDVIICGQANDLALHAGKSEYGDLKNLNNHFWGVEMQVSGKMNYEGFKKKIGLNPKTGKPMDPLPESPYTKEQYKALAWLWFHLKAQVPELDIPVEHITTHEAVSGDAVRGEGKGKVDPGPTFDVRRLQGLIRIYERNMEVQDDHRTNRTTDETATQGS